MSELYESVLLIGDRGMLAYAVKRSLTRRGIKAAGVDHDVCDITQPESVSKTFEKHRPTLVINCAAYTAVDKAEQEEDRATAVNGDGPRNLAEACADCGAALVHYSTDFVFDGQGHSPYKVEDKPNPIGAYGRSKLAGEIGIEQTGFGNWLTIRTAWLYGPGPGRPFPKVMLDAARLGKPLRVINDQHGSPTFTFDLADATLDLLDHDARGLFHVTGGGRTTWFGFTGEIMNCFGVTPASLEPITSDEWATLKPDSAHRPAFSVLDLSRAEAAMARPMRNWESALRDYRDVCAGNP